MKSQSNISKRISSLNKKISTSNFYAIVCSSTIFLNLSSILGGVGGWVGRESSDGSDQNAASGFVRHQVLHTMHGPN